MLTRRMRVMFWLELPTPPLPCTLAPQKPLLLCVVFYGLAPPNGRVARIAAGIALLKRRKSRGLAATSARTMGAPDSYPPGPLNGLLFGGPAMRKAIRPAPPRRGQPGWALYAARHTSQPSFRINTPTTPKNNTRTKPVPCRRASRAPRAAPSTLQPAIGRATR